MRLLLLLLPGLLLGQSALPPVVLVNGYQPLPCGESKSQNTFGALEEKLRATGREVIWFDNCTVPAAAAARPTMEELGNALGQRIRNSGAAQVDIVAHSMGGLIVRSYLAGKQNAPRTFQPPVDPRVRKAVFLGTPHFGPGLVALLLGAAGNDPQVQALLPGSRFLFDLATWNGGGDDLRGIDAIAIAGDPITSDAGPGVGDGLVDVTSASLSFAAGPGRLRLVPYCHVSELMLLYSTCSSRPSLASVNSDEHLSWRIIRSFLSGTDEWKQLGASEGDTLAHYGGLLLSYQDKSGEAAPVPAKIMAGDTELTKGSFGWYEEFVPGGTRKVQIAGASGVDASVTITPGRYTTAVIKPGPAVAAVLPAAAAGPRQARSLAPGMFVSLYGSALAETSEQANALPLPEQLGGTTVTASGKPLRLHFADPGQINAILPEDAAGSLTLEVRNPQGMHQIHVLVEQSAPAIFTQSGSGTGPASALNAVTNALITPGAPARSGDIISLYLTGLGATEERQGLLWARVLPQIEIGGVIVTPQYAGRAPGYVGLDQINFVVPVEAVRGPAVSLRVLSRNRVSNSTTLALE